MIANVAHSSLTGSNLHEPKGVASATANKVYVSDGAGSGAWTAHSTFSGVFGNALLHARELQGAGVNSGSAFTSSTWNTVFMNTTPTNEISGSSLNAGTGEVTLPTGTYFCIGRVNLKSSSTPIFKLRLRNITAGTTLIVGPQFTGYSPGGIDLSGHVIGRFTLGSSQVIALQCYPNATTTGGQSYMSTGEAEVYAEFWVWKL